MRKLARLWTKTEASTLLALLLNLLLAYVVYAVCRGIYLLENYAYFADGLSPDLLWRMCKGGYMFDRTAITYTNLPYIALMLLPLWSKENNTYKRVCKWLYMVVNGAAVAVNLADAVYFPYTLRRTTTTVFDEFSNETNLGGVFLTEVARHWYLVLAFVVLAYAMHRLYVKPRTLREWYDTRAKKWRYAGVMLLSLAVAVPLCIGACRGGLGHGIRPITINNANQYVNRPIECAVVLNTPFSLLRTIGKSVFEKPHYYDSEESLDAVYTPIHRPQADTLRRKNVVILIVESFGREYIGALNKDVEGYKGYTPCLDEIIGRSATFRYSYCNGRKSIDGMPSVLSGIPMFVEPFVLTPASMNTYTGIAGLLAAEGYDTAFFHGANRGSMGFMAFANKIGFGQYYGRQDYAADSRFGGDADFDGHWGIWDEPFLQYFCTKMGEMKEPFMTALFTVSSHHPFVIPDAYKDVYKEEELPIHKCVRYTDHAIGRFFEEAARQPWFANTLFVITSDHTNISNHPEYQTDLGRFCAPVIIYDPSGGIAPGVREGIAQQTDIMPTVLGQLGYGKPYLAFGVDLFDTPAEETFAVNYLNGVYQYVRGGYVLQFDGHRTTGLYALDDRLMRHNLAGQADCQAQMEAEVKALIQQYMDRMVDDRLVPDVRPTTESE